MLATVATHSRQQSRRFQVNADDVADAVMVSLVVLSKNNPGWMHDGEDKNAYLRTAATNAAYAIANRDRSRAVNEAHARLDRAVRAKNTSLTGSQVQELAGRVEAQMPDAKLPKGWWAERQRHESIDNMLTEPSVGSAEDEYLAGDLATEFVPNESVWQSMCRFMDAPPVTPALVQEDQAVKVRKMMAELGGVSNAVAAWEADEATDDAMFVLFNPWGSNRPGSAPRDSVRSRWVPPSFAEQEEVVRVLKRLGSDRAADAWQSALRDASYYSVRGKGRGHGEINLGKPMKADG